MMTQAPHLTGSYPQSSLLPTQPQLAAAQGPARTHTQLTTPVLAFRAPLWAALCQHVSPTQGSLSSRSLHAHVYL